MFCTNCGAQNAAGTKFCTTCGNALAAEQAASTQQPLVYQQPVQPVIYQQPAPVVTSGEKAIGLLTASKTMGIIGLVFSLLLFISNSGKSIESLEHMSESGTIVFVSIILMPIAALLLGIGAKANGNEKGMSGVALGIIGLCFFGLTLLLMLVN